MLGIALADFGYHVLTAENGKQALELYTQYTPPIIITDIKMPVMDGIELLKRIKQENPDTEVIMLTGHGDMELAINCLKLEATDFVTKPVNDDAMEIALKRANEKIRMRRQLRSYTENLERLVEEKSAQLVAAERRAAVGQALEGLIAAMHNIASDLDTGIQYFNDLPCFVSLHSPELKIVAVNQRFASKLGDKTGQSSCRAYEPGDDCRTPCPAEETFRTGKGQRCNATVRLVDGSETSVIVHTAPIRNASGAVTLVVEIAADVAEIRRLQDELRTTQQRYEQLFNAAPCYITVQDHQLRVTEANRRFREDFGNTANARCYEIYQQRSQSCPDCPVAKTFHDGLPHQCEMDVTAADGTVYRMLIWTSPLRDHTGKITHVMEMSTDVTQMRHLQDQLASLGLMIGSVSHGIKGLLTGLDSGIYLLDSGFSKENLDRVKDGWQVVRLMIERIRSLVLDILFYAKEKDLKWERVDVLEFAKDIADPIQPEIKRRAITLKCMFDEQLKEFEVDAGIVRATLANVLENAMEACSSDTDKQKNHCIEFKVYPDQDRICFEIGDNGIGMDQATQAKIFTPYFITQKKTGTGLGLFIASQILKKNNGEITVQSNPGQGTRVFIKLPVTPAAGLNKSCVVN